MKISSSQIAFNSEHQKASIHEYSKQKTESHQRTTLRTDGQPLGNSVTVDLSYNARMRSEQAASTYSISSVKQAGQETTYQQSKNISSVVSTVLNQDIRLESVQPMPRVMPERPQPVIETELAQMNQEIQRLDASQSSIDLSNINIDFARIEERAISLGGVRVAEEAIVDIQEQHLFKEQERMKMDAQGTIMTEDGREISFMLELEMERNFELEESLEQHQHTRRLLDPLVINLDGGTAGLTSSSFTFDLDANGDAEEISFVTQGSGFLALDINEDGQINDGSELFGTQGTDGFAHLARYDDDGNKWIDESDEIFSDLKVWTRDEQGNDQLLSLKDAGVGAIYLGSTASKFDLTDSENNLLGQVKRSGMFLMENGQAASIQELDLAVHNQAADPSAEGTDPHNLADSYLHLKEQLLENHPPLPETRMERLDVRTIPRSSIELQLPPADPETRQISRYEEATFEQTIEQSESHENSTATVTQKAEPQGDEVEETEEGQGEKQSMRIMHLDESRLEILARLGAKTERQLSEQEDRFSQMREIIDDLRKLHETRSSQA